MLSLMRRFTIRQLQEGTRHAVQTMQSSVDSAREVLEAIAESVSTITDMTQHVAPSAEEQFRVE